jgi:2-polyprenyl-3-methyl-5-hydroxy-6-metoxy-1,4-benzoquinol methylase
MPDATQAATAVTVDRQFGAVLEGRWVPAPRFVLRRDRVLPLTENLPAGRVIEVGCGSGALLREFASRGHECLVI